MSELPHDTSRRRRDILLLVVAVAAVWRLVFVLEVHDHPYYLTPLIDAADYHTRAMQVMRGEGLGEPIFYKAPAYPFMVGLVYRLSGAHLEVIYILQMLGGVVGAGLVAWLGMRWFGCAVGLLGGLLTAFYGVLAYFENQLLIESSALFFCIVAVVLLELSRRAWMDLLAGGCAGIALQLRPINLAFVVALLVWLLLQKGSATRRLQRVMLLLIPVLLLLTPTLRHNRVGSGRLVPISVNGGINFFIGNNPDYDKTVGIRPGLSWEELTKRFDAMDDPVQWQRNFYAAAFDYIRQQPGDYARLLFKKLILFWNAREIDRNQDSSVMRAESRVLRSFSLPFGVIAVFGLLGLGISWRRARQVPLHALVLLQMCGVLAFFVTSRYRFAVVPWLALTAALAIVELIKASSRRRWGRLAGFGLVGVALALLVIPDHYAIARLDFGRPDFDTAQVLARTGDREGALVAYEKAVERHPDDPDVLFRYGQHLERLRRRPEAIRAYLRAEKLAPSSYKPPLARGAAHLLDDDLEAAWGAFEEAVRRGDPHGRSFYNMGLVRERQARYEEALELYRLSLEQPDTVVEQSLRRLAAGRMLVFLSRPEAAEVEFAAAVRLNQDPSVVAVERAEAFLAMGQPMTALRGLEAVPSLAVNARGQYLRALALQRLGRLSEAHEAARIACRLDPENALYRNLLGDLEIQ